MTSQAQMPCPHCNQPTYPKDVTCMSCGGNLMSLRAQQKRTAEGRERVEAARRYITQAKAKGLAEEAIYDALFRQGWQHEHLCKLIEIPSEALVIGLPDRGHVIASTAKEAKAAKSQIRLAAKGLRLDKREINAAIKETRQTFKATQPGPMARRASYGRGSIAKIARGIDDAGRAAHRAAVERHKTERDQAIAQLESQKITIDERLLEYDRLVAYIDEWLLRQQSESSA